MSEVGTISVQPTATTALMIASDALSVTGTVYDPPVDYAASACALSAIQNGDAVSGAWCGRSAGFTFSVQPDAGAASNAHLVQVYSIGGAGIPAGGTPSIGGLARTTRRPRT